MMRIFVKNGQYYGIDEGQVHLIPVGAVETTQEARDALPENVAARKNAALDVQISGLVAKVDTELILAAILRPNAIFADGKKPAEIMLDIDNQLKTLKASKV